MKTLPAVGLLVLCAGGGALVHHATEGGRQAPPLLSADFPYASGARPSRTAKEMADLVKELDYPLGADRRLAWDSVLSALRPADFPAWADALADRLGEKRAIGDNDAWSSLIEYWAATDARGLVAYVERKAAAKGKLTYTEQAIAREEAKAVAKACLIHDAATAISYLRRLGGNMTEKEKVWEAFAAAATELNGAATLTAAEQSGVLDTGEARYFGNLVRQRAQQDPAAAMALAQNRPLLLPQALLGWMGKAPAGAMAWMQQHQTAAKQPDIFEQVALAYAEEHPREAEIFREATGDDAALDLHIAKGMVKLTPLEALPFIEKTGAKSDLYEMLAHALSRRPPEEGVAVIKAMPEGELRDLFYQRLCDWMQARDPAAAVKFCTQVPELLASYSTDRVFTGLAKRDPETAAQWLKPGRLPDELVKRVMPEVLDAWMVRDRAAALQFVDILPASEAKGRVLLEASRLQKDGTPDTALAYAMTLPDLATRIGACRWIEQYAFKEGDRITERHRDAAAKWLAAIPDAAVRKALEPPPPEKPKEEEVGQDPFSTPDAGDGPPAEDPFGAPGAGETKPER